MQAGFNTVQLASGRWKWLDTHKGQHHGHFGDSFVTFPSEAAAKADLDEFLTAHRISGQRRLRERKQIENLIQMAADGCVHCADLKVGEISWHEPDVTGCNWSLYYTDGENAMKCFDNVGIAVFELRNMYNIPDKA